MVILGIVENKGETAIALWLYWDNGNKMETTLLLGL